MINDDLKKDLKASKPILIKYFHEGKYEAVLKLLSEISIPYLMQPSKYDRFIDVLPYNNEVSLKYGIAYSNASFVNVGEFSYIACQEPKDEYINLFLDLIKRSQIKIVLSLKGKCNYFSRFTPKSHKILKFDNEDFIDHKIFVVENAEVHNVVCNVWPDKGILTFEQLCYLDNYLESLNFGPILIHCLAGVGRTGTLIMFRHLRKIGKVTIEVFVEALILLRSQRHLLIESSKQLEFLYNIFVNE